jgi:hypothetical protein
MTEEDVHREEIEKTKSLIEENNAKLSKSGIDDEVKSSYRMLINAVAGKSELAEHIINRAVSAIDPWSDSIKSLKIALESLDEQKPRDATEVRLAAQAAALFSHGMSNLKRAETADMMCHSEHYSNKAIKLLRLHIETVEALNRHRRGGEQKVTVTHAVITEKAIVNFNGVGGGAYHKNEGGSPCNTRNAAPSVEEPAQVSHVETMQLPGQEDVGCTAEKVPAQRQKKAVNA